MSLAAFDSRLNRRDLWHLIHRLAPWDRVRFLAGRCRLVKPPAVPPSPSLFRMRPRIEAAHRGDYAQDEALTTDVYGDLVLLDCQYGVPLGESAAALEALVRRPAPASSSPGGRASPPGPAASRTPCTGRTGPSAAWRGPRTS